MELGKQRLTELRSCSWWREKSIICLLNILPLAVNSRQQQSGADYLLTLPSSSNGVTSVVHFWLHAFINPEPRNKRDIVNNIKCKWQQRRRRLLNLTGYRVCQMIRVLCSARFIPHKRNEHSSAQYRKADDNQLSWHGVHWESLRQFEIVFMRSTSTRMLGLFLLSLLHF